MHLWGRAAVSAAAGGLAGALYAPSVQFTVDSVCSGGLDCLGLAVIAIPVLLTWWVLVAWLLMWVLRVPRAWQVGVLGPVLVLALFLLLSVLGVRFYSRTEIVLGCLAACAYGLAGLLTGLLDRKAHSGT